MQLADGVRTWPEEREKNLNVQILLLKQVQYVPFIEEISVNSPEQQEGKSSHKGGRFCRGRVQNEKTTVKSALLVDSSHHDPGLGLNFIKVNR